MSTPVNYDLQDVHISVYDETTETKKYFREPEAGNKKYLDPVVIEAQVRFYDSDEQYYTDLGDQVKSTGTLVIDYEELEDTNLTELKPGDLIVQIDDTECYYRINEVQKKRRFVKVYFNEAKYKIGGVR